MAQPSIYERVSKMQVRYMCLLCGRCKFTQKSPHNCGAGGRGRKRGIKWQKNVYYTK